MDKNLHTNNLDNTGIEEFEHIRERLRRLVELGKILKSHKKEKERNP